MQQGLAPSRSAAQRLIEAIALLLRLRARKLHLDELLRPLLDVAVQRLAHLVGNGKLVLQLL